MPDRSGAFSLAIYSEPWVSVILKQKIPSPCSRSNLNLMTPSLIRALPFLPNGDAGMPAWHVK
jgi:hypothetical protein